LLLSQVASTPVLGQVGALVGAGDLAGARAAIREGRTRTPSEILDVYLAIYFDYGWLLDDEGQRRVLAAPLEAFDGDAATQALVQAQLYRVRGDTVRSRTAAALAVRGFSEQIRGAPQDVQLPVLRAFSAGLAGKSDQTHRLIEESQAILDRAQIGVANRSYFEEVLARARVLDGEYDRALDEIEKILARPGWLSAGHLQLDPIWAPLRGNSRFEKLIAQRPVT
jgi:hypothetical protein